MDEEENQNLALLLHLRRKYRGKDRRVWVHPVLQRREALSAMYAYPGILFVLDVRVYLGFLAVGCWWPESGCFLSCNLHVFLF